MKLRTNKTVSKRVSITGSGKVKYTQESHQHLRHNKSKRSLRNAKGMAIVPVENIAKIKKLVPYL